MATEEQQQRTSDRLSRQLPAKQIKQRTNTIFTRSQHPNKNGKSSANRSEKLTVENQGNLQVDLDTDRSLSSVPTYSSLSGRTLETRECATQITTLPPIEIVEDTSDESPRPVYLLDETELMPISNGFGAYPVDHRAANARRLIQPKTESGDLQNYREQFRSRQQRERDQKGLNSNSLTKSKARTRPTAVRELPPSRPIAAKRSPPSDSLSMASKRQDSNSKVPKNNFGSSSFRRAPPKQQRVVESPPAPPPLPVEKKRVEPARKNGVVHSPLKYSNTPDSQQDLGRKPVRVPYKHDTAYYSSPTASMIYQKPAPIPQEISEKPRIVRVANNNYIVQRRRQPASDHGYDDYHRDNYVEKPRQKRLVRVVRNDDDDYDDDDRYYVESAPTPRRIPVARKPPPPPAEYVYVDDPPAQVRHRRVRPPPPPSRRPEVYYVDDNRSHDHEEDYAYVDEDGNEVQVVDERNQSPEYVQYIYDDERDRRRSQKPKVVYVDDDGTNNHVRERHRSKPPSSTQVVYE